MRKTVKINAEKPQYVVTTDVSFAQVDSWFGHTRRDLKMDIIYPEDKSLKKYPCIVWICGGAWLMMDKSAHLAYLSKLAMQGFTVASVEYRTSNEVKYPGQLEDVKAAIRYLRAHAARYRIDSDHIGVMGESAGGHLACLAALNNSGELDTGEYLEYSSSVQAACPWYPPTDLSRFKAAAKNEDSGKPESLLIGKSAINNKKESLEASPVDYVTKDAPPFMFIHGNDDHTVPYEQSIILYDMLDKLGCDVTLVTIDGADHADIRFFQDEIWDEIAAFFKEKLA